MNKPQRVTFAFPMDLSGHRCDFICEKNEPLISLYNTNTRHEWYCHLSCLQEHIVAIEEINGATDKVH